MRCACWYLVREHSDKKKKECMEKTYNRKKKSLRPKCVFGVIVVVVVVVVPVVVTLVFLLGSILCV